MLIACPNCSLRYNVPGETPRAKCMCGTTFDVTPPREPSMDDILASIKAILATDPIDDDDILVLDTSPAPPTMALAVIAAHDVVYDVDPVFLLREPAPNDIEPYRRDPSWRFIVATVDNLVRTLTDMEDHIIQYAYGAYNVETDQFDDPANIVARAREATNAFGLQYSRLPDAMQDILHDYADWTITSTQFCGRLMGERLDEARLQFRDQRNTYLAMVQAERERVEAEAAETEWKRERQRRAMAELTSSIDNLGYQQARQQRQPEVVYYQEPHEKPAHNPWKTAFVLGAAYHLWTRRRG